MPNLTASIPHQLGRDEAKRRIKEQIGQLRQQDATFANVQETWNGDTLAFGLKAMGQSISGQVVVEEHVIHLTVALPWILSLMGGTIKKQLEQQGRLMLEAPRK